MVLPALCMRHASFRVVSQYPFLCAALVLFLFPAYVCSLRSRDENRMSAPQKTRHGPCPVCRGRRNVGAISL